MTTKTPRLRTVAALLCAFALLAAACGGDDEPAAPATTTDDSDTGTTDDSDTGTMDDSDTTDDSDTGTTDDSDTGTMDDADTGTMDDADTMEAMEEVELRMAIWNEQQLEVHEQLAEAFRQHHPNISVNVEVIPKDFWQIVKTQIAGGDPPDLIWINVPNFPDLAINGALMPITDLVERDGVDLSPFPQALVDSYTLDGELYGISKDYDTVGLFYRVDLFDEAGLDYPDETWTWDDLKAAAAALTTDDVWGFAAGLTIQEHETVLIRQNGGQVVSADGRQVLYGEPENCEAIQFLHSFHTDGTAPDQLTQDATHHWGLFADGRVAMIYDGSWASRSYLDNEHDIDVAPLPRGKQRANVIHGLSWGILSDTDHPDEAWEFLKFLASEEAHLLQATTGAVIPSYAGTAAQWVEGFGDEMNVQVLLDQVEIATPFPSAAAPILWYWTAARPVLQDAFRGNIPFPEACDRAAEAANSYIADNSYR